jgi:hypothetical protein
LSIRLVVQTYTGPLIQVRRSNDSATTNIYPSSTGDLNTVTLLAFTGSNSAYISIWYDQSGGQFNAVQATSSSQPQIVASGVVITKNGQPAPTFTSSSTMGINGFTDTTNNVFASSVFSMSTGPQNYYPVFGMSSGSSVSCYNNVNDIGFFFSFTSGQLSALRQGLLQINANGMTYGSVQVASVAISGATHVISLDGTSTSYTTTSTVFAGSYVGVGGCAGNVGFVGSISEIILTTNVPTSIQQAELLATQQAYFTVPTPKFTLDRVSATPLAAYGLRQLRSGYTGPAFIVRATNTGASTSIYFLADGTLDLTTLQQLCVGTTCYITTWYDQTGNGHTMSQSTTADQPQLILSDPVSVYYTGFSTSTYLTNSGGISGVVAVSAVIQIDQKSATFSDCCISFTGMSGDDASVRGSYSSNALTFTWETNSGNLASTGQFNSPNLYIDNYMQYNMAANNLHTFHSLAGTNWNSATCTAASGGTACKFNNIGGISTAGDRYWPGLINEVIYWGTTPSTADQTTVFQDQHRLCQTVNQTALDVSAARAANQITAVYGMRNVLSSNRRPCMQVWNPTTGYYFDVPFTWAGLIDTTILNDFCTGVTCQIVKWYDQSGNIYDLVATTNYILVALNANNGLPAINCVGNVASLQTVQDFTPTVVTAVQSINNGAVAVAGIIGWQTTAVSDGVELRIDGNPPGSHVGWNSGTLSAGDWGYNSNQTPNIFVDNAFTATQAMASTHSVSTGGANGPSPATYPINLCAPANTPTARYWYGTVSEVILATLASPYAFNISDRATLFLEQAYIYGIANPFLLDKLSGTANAAFSLRRLKASYTGYCIQVIRSSDSTSANIGFTTTGLLDTTTLGTFCYSTTCSVTTWYDQSGNGYNAVTSYAPQMPTIVYLGQNAQPYLNFFTNATVFPQLEITASTTFSSVNMVLAWQTGTVASSVALLPVLSALNVGEAITLAIGSPPAGYSAIGTRFNMCSAMYVNNANTVSQAASTQPSSVYCPTSAAQTLIAIGAAESTYVGQFWEVIAFNAALSTADQNMVYYNQKGFWGTG